MWLRIIYLIMLSAAELAVGDDVEIDANIRLDPAFMANVKQNLDDELEYFRFTSNDDDPFHDRADRTYASPEIARANSEDNPYLTQIRMYEERSHEKGKDSIKGIAEYLEKKLNIPRDDMIPVVNKITFNFTSQIKKYFSGISFEIPDSEVDREYIILDMINVVFLITRDVEKSLLNKAINMTVAKESDSEIDILVGTLDTFNEFDKRQEVDFICETLGVCRPNPAFSEYFFQLLNNILDLNNDKLHYFLIKSSQLLLKKQSLFDTILRDNIIEWFKSKFDNMVTANIAQMRKALTILRTVTIRRYDTDRMNDRHVKIRAKSAAIITDIVDVAFGIDGDALYGIQMNKIISAVKDWADGIGRDIEQTLEDTAQYIVEAMNYNLTPRAREEIKALADVIFLKKSRPQKDTEYLMTEGSKFVKGLVYRKESKRFV